MTEQEHIAALDERLNAHESKRWAALLAAKPEIRRLPPEHYAIAREAFQCGHSSALVIGNQIGLESAVTCLRMDGHDAAADHLERLDALQEEVADAHQA